MKFKFRSAAAALRHRRVENTCIEHAAKLILLFSPSSNSFVVFGFDNRTPILASQSVSGALRYFTSPFLELQHSDCTRAPRAYYHLLNY